MKIRRASTIVCAVVFVLNSVANIILLNIGQDLNRPYRVPAPIWLWIVVIVAIVLKLVLLLLRPVMLNNYHRVACAVLSLLFLSIIGGIMTFAAEEGLPHKAASSKKVKINYSLLHDSGHKFEIGEIVKLKDGRQGSKANYAAGTKGKVTKVSADNTMITVCFITSNGDEEYLPIHRTNLEPMKPNNEKSIEEQ